MIALPPLTPARSADVSHLLDRVHHCDALDLLRALPDASVDSVISDPPYGAQIAAWDMDIPPQAILTECLRVSRGPVVWFGGRVTSDIAKVMDYEPIPVRILIWHVTFSTIAFAASGMFYRWHPIYCWRLPEQRVIARDIIEFPQTGKDNWWHHPGTKPLALMDLLVRAFGGDLILDPFAGSGTTLLAAKRLKRHYIGGDISAEYVAIAQSRLSDLPRDKQTGDMVQRALFTETAS